jgi:hypothetical protein
VQRDGEADRLGDLVHEAAQAREPADRRDRRPPVGDPDLGQSARGGEHVVEVQHRLAHAHEDRVVHGPEPAEVQRLVEDLPRRQVPAEAHGASGAEAAGQRAAGLRGEAE